MTLRPEYRLGGEIVLRPSDPLYDHPSQPAESVFATNYRRTRYRQALLPTPERAAWLDVLEGKIARAPADAEALVRPHARASGARKRRLGQALTKRWGRMRLGGEGAR